MSRNLLALSIFALAGAIVYASTPEATAQPPVEPTCEHFGALKDPTTTAKRWLVEHAAGRAHVLSFDLLNSQGSVVCVW